MSDAMNGKTGVITGATGGIGFYSALEKVSQVAT